MLTGANLAPPDLLPSLEEIEWARLKARSTNPMLALLTLLTCAEALGYLPQFRDIPIAIRDRIVKHLQGLGVSLQPDLTDADEPNRNKIYGQFHPWIRQRLGWRIFTDQVEAALTNHLTIATQTQYSASDLVNAAVEWLLNGRVELPALSTLRRICGRINAASNSRVDAVIAAKLNPWMRQMLDGLLVAQAENKPAQWSRVRERPEAPTYCPCVTTSNFPTGCGHSAIWRRSSRICQSHAFVTSAHRPVSSDRATSPSSPTSINHRYAVMLACLVETQQLARDTLTTFFCRRMRLFEKQAHEDLDNQHRQQRSLVVRIVTGSQY